MRQQNCYRGTQAVVQTQRLVMCPPETCDAIAFEAVLAYGLTKLAFDRIVAGIDPENAASIKVTQKICMRLERENKYPVYSIPDRLYSVRRLNLDRKMTSTTENRRNPDATLIVREFREENAASVIALFRETNRLMAPADKKQAFDAYVERSITEEIGRIRAYYAELDGGFWVAEAAGELVGMFGLETASDISMELRRMYVKPAWRRRGVAQRMLRFAEKECVGRGKTTLELSTSELQAAALRLYRREGFDLVSQESAASASNKTIGGGIRRFHFRKSLLHRATEAHKAMYPDPIIVEMHEQFTLSGRTDNWDGYIWNWARARDGREGWVPDDLAVRVDGRIVAAYDYSARELDIAVSVCVHVQKSLNGWSWCVNGNGEEGWIPLKDLTPC